MNEPKLCPMRKITEIYEVGTIVESTMPGFSLCFQDLCAWWVKRVRISDKINFQTGYPDEYDDGSHCAILDLRKP